jgi:hypothetical protein
MSFSAYSWKGVTRYFKTLDFFRCTRPIHWNERTSGLEVNSKPPKLLWIVGETCSFFIGVFYPFTLIFDQIYWKSIKVSAAQAVFCILYFSSTIQSLPVFLHLYFISANDYVNGFNHIVSLEKFIWGMKL